MTAPIALHLHRRILNACSADMPYRHGGSAYAADGCILVLISTRGRGTGMNDVAHTPRKVINVVGAAIVRNGKVLCARRGEGRSLAGYWEFPGGKIEAHETAREALHREIEEELLCEVEVADEVCTSSYDYDFGTVILTTFVCHLISGTPRLTEHREIRWALPADMPGLDWAPADRDAVRRIATMDLARK